MNIKLSPNAKFMHLEQGVINIQNAELSYHQASSSFGIAMCQP